MKLDWGQKCGPYGPRRRLLAGPANRWSGSSIEPSGRGVYSQTMRKLTEALVNQALFQEFSAESCLLCSSQHNPREGETTILVPGLEAEAHRPRLPLF